MVGPSVNKLGRVKKAKMLDCMYKLYREEPCELCPSKYRQPSTSFSSFSAPSVTYLGLKSPPTRLTPVRTPGEGRDDFHSKTSSY